MAGAGRTEIDREVSNVVTIVPAATPLESWRGIYFDATPRLPICRPRVDAGAAAVERIIELGEPCTGSTPASAGSRTFRTIRAIS